MIHESGIANRIVPDLAAARSSSSRTHTLTLSPEPCSKTVGPKSPSCPPLGCRMSVWSTSFFLEFFIDELDPGCL